MVLFSCGVGFGIVMTVFAIGLVLWFLARKGLSIVASKNDSIRWHRGVDDA